MNHELRAVYSTMLAAQAAVKLDNAVSLCMYMIIKLVWSQFLQSTFQILLTFCQSLLKFWSYSCFTGQE